MKQIKNSYKFDFILYFNFFFTLYFNINFFIALKKLKIKKLKIKRHKKINFLYNIQ